MSHASVLILKDQVKAQLAQLTFLREYREKVDEPSIKSALIFAIEDTQEAIARVTSRLRQLNQTVDDALDQSGEKLLRQARSRRSEADKVRFVHHGLKHQLEWYSARIKDLREDPDSQAIFAALAEQTRVRLKRWESLMTDLKVSPD